MSPRPADTVRNSWSTGGGADRSREGLNQQAETAYLRDLATSLVGERYIVGELIGRGGMAAVFEAQDVRLQRAVALKVLPPDLARRADIRERFVREAQTAAKLNHKNIVQIFSVDEADSVVCFAMTLVRGESLAARMRREPRLELNFVARVLEQLSDALAYAHASGVVHRDIKPDNVLLETGTEAGGERVVVTDFGIAHAVDSGPRLTKTGVAVGTPAFMSPEQAMGEKQIDGRSDIYSVGVMGYLMLTGRLPFDAGSTPALLLKHVNEPLSPISVVRPGVPYTLAAIVERCLAKRPQDRWESALALRDALRMVQRDGSLVKVGLYKSDRPAVSWQPVAPPILPVVSPVVSSESAEIAKRTKALRKHLREAFICFIVALLMAVGPHGSVRAIVFLIAAVAAVGFQVSLLRAAWDTLKLWRLGASPLKLFSQRQLDSANQSRGGQGATGARELAAKVASALTPGSRYGSAIEKASSDRVAIGEIVQRLGKADRELVPDVLPTADKLLESIGSLAVSLDRLERDLSGDSIAQLKASLSALPVSQPHSDEHENRRSLLERQIRSLEQLGVRRDALKDQLDRATTAMHTLRLDLVRLETMGVSALAQDRTNLTEQVRSISRNMDIVIDAAAESGRFRTQ